MSEQRGSESSVRAQAHFRELQTRLCDELAALDGAAEFSHDEWRRPGGGGGVTAIIANGDLLEKGGVNWSAVWGELEGAPFVATGISIVLHARSPMVPTVHANLRYFERDRDAWFGGGCDLTPVYPVLEDARNFHTVWKGVCDRHDPGYYSRFKRWCDEYFYLPHRGETRGVGGIFFDDLRGDFETLFAFVRDCGEAFMPAYAPIAQRRRAEPYGEEERRFQALRRGRYVEFNLIYDRGTAFGLATHGRTESILMSLPPLARWEYGWQAAPGSREAQALGFFQPRDWLANEQHERARARGAGVAGTRPN